MIGKSPVAQRSVACIAASGGAFAAIAAAVAAAAAACAAYAASRRIRNSAAAAVAARFPLLLSIYPLPGFPSGTRRPALGVDSMAIGVDELAR